MKITELKNQYVKLSDRSITCKDKETGKTCGVVRGIKRFKNIQANKQHDYFKKLREAKIWGNGHETDNVYVHEGKIYYMVNMNSERYYNDEKFNEVLAEEKERYFNKIKDAENAGINVIKAYFL